MPRIAIQIDYTDAAPGYFNWLNAKLPEHLRSLGLDARVFVAPQRIQGPDAYFNDQSVYLLTEPLINNSPIRMRAETEQIWFAHVLIATYHESGHLGLMYDFGFDERSRQGCAIFASRIKDLTGMVYEDFCSVLLRVVLHELGHCFNLLHTQDWLVMAQTADLQNRYGAGWISRISYRFSPENIRYLQENEAEAKPGNAYSRIGIISDQSLRQRSNLKVTLKLLLDRGIKSFEKGDAVSLLITIRNTRKRKITIISPLDPNIENYKVWLRTPGGKERQLINAIHGCGTPMQKLEIAGGEIRHFPLQLFADNIGYLFNISGTYHVAISVLTEADTWVKSNYTSFIINDTGTDSETLNSPDVLKYMLLGDSHRKSTHRKIKKTIETNPKSGFSRAIYWNQYYTLKKKIRTTTDPRMDRQLAKKLIALTSRLLAAETSSIRKGKILLEQQSAATLLKRENMKLTLPQKKNVRDYQQFENKAIKKSVNNVFMLPHRIQWPLLLAFMASFLYSCSKVDYVERNVVYGTLSYNHIRNGSRPVPAGQEVNVFLNNELSSIYSFTTSEQGQYSFSPNVKGDYIFEISYIDSLLQYNATLVEQADIDTLRRNGFQPVAYTFRSNTPVFINKKDRSFQRNITLEAKVSGINLLIVDELDRPLAGVKVCIYSNQEIATANSPYCGGCQAYLNSDANGIVTFIGLQPQAYYINARGKFGIVSLSNQYTEEMKTTGILQAGAMSTKKIILK